MASPNPGDDEALAGTGRFSSHLVGAVVVVVLVAEAGRGVFDIRRAAQNMMLAADALGIGSCPATLHDQEAVHRLPGIPQDRPATHAITFGHPDHDLEATIRQDMKAVTGSPREAFAEGVKTDRFSWIRISGAALAPLGR
jgi:nitroreductase